MAAIDVGFVLAVVAFGWGLSLATYRRIARHCGWPMGHGRQHSPRPADRARILSILLAMLFAWRAPAAGMAQRGGDPGVRRRLGGVLDRLPARRGAERPAARSRRRPCC